MSSYKLGQALDNDLRAIGINVAATEKSIDPNIEETLIAASVEAVNDKNNRIAGLLVDWISLHYGRINVDRLTKLVMELRGDKFKYVGAFWAANAQRLYKTDWRFKKLVGVYHGPRVDYVDRFNISSGDNVTKMFLEIRGEDERFKATCLRVPHQVFSFRPHQIFSAYDISRSHMGFRYRVMFGASYRADVWALLRRNPKLSGYRLAQLAYCSATAASKIKKDYLIVKRDYSHRNRVA